MKSKRSSSGKSFPPLGPDTKVFVVWVERFDDIGRLIFLKPLLYLQVFFGSIHSKFIPKETIASQKPVFSAQTLQSPEKILVVLYLSSLGEVSVSVVTSQSVELQTYFLNLTFSKKGESKARRNVIISSKLIDKLERHYRQITV